MINHPESGLNSALQPYYQDQYAFGTSAIGLFKNPEYLKRSSCPFIFKNYGVDNLAIDEGRNGMIDYIFVVYNWTANRCVKELCVGDNGLIDEKLIANLPSSIKEAYKNDDFNTKFKLVHGIVPREDFNPKAKAGKLSAKYRGVWFMEGQDCKIFAEEDYKTIPIAVCRQMRIRGEVWGVSSGTLLISSIKTMNFALGQVMEILEKMNEPPLAMFNNAIVGDSVLDTSSGSITVFNESLLGNAKTPVMPLHDIGDPTAIITWLEPFLNNKITSAFKLDMLLDFNSSATMTASEATQRFIIRGQALAGLLNQQFNELVYPVASRSISIAQDLGELGTPPDAPQDLIRGLKERNLADRIIPQPIWDAMKNNESWFNIIPNERVRKMLKTERIEALSQFLNFTAMTAQLNPQVLQAVDFYGIISDIATELNMDKTRLVGEQKYNDIIKQQQEMQAQAMQLQSAQVGASTAKDASQARKNATESVNNR
jgi:hypothetical protein